MGLKVPSWKAFRAIKPPRLTLILSWREKEFCSFLKSQIFYSIRAANEISSDSSCRPCGCVRLLFPLISSFLFQARIISFFHTAKRHRRQTKFVAPKPPTTTTSNAGTSFARKSRKREEEVEAEEKNFKHWYKFLWWFTDTKIMWCGGGNIDFLASLSLRRRPRRRHEGNATKSLFRIHKCLNKHEQKKIVFS